MLANNQSNGYCERYRSHIRQLSITEPNKSDYDYKTLPVGGLRLTTLLNLSLNAAKSCLLSCLVINEEND